MCEYHVGGESLFQRFEKVLDFSSDVREIPVPELFDRDGAVPRAFQEYLRACPRFFLSTGVRTEHHPMDLGIHEFFQDAE
jgi:hypothetical protein